jgi:hypothetical protein
MCYCVGWKTDSSEIKNEPSALYHSRGKLLAGKALGFSKIFIVN